MKKYLLITPFLCLVLLIGTFFFLKTFYLKDVAHYLLQKNGLHPKSYSFKDVDIKLYPLNVSFKKLNYEHGLKGNAYWTFDTDSISITIKPKTLWSQGYYAKSLNIVGLNVVLSEVIPIIKKKKAKGFDFSKFNFELDKLKVENSKFTYIDADRKGERSLGIIKITDINISSDNISDHSLFKTSQKIFANGSMNDSQINIELNARFNKNPDIKLDLEVKNQKISAFNTYVEPVEGFSLSGDIILGVARLSVKDKKLDASTKIRFKEFEIKVLNNEKRNALQTFFSQWAVNNLSCSKRLGKLRPIKAIHASMNKEDRAWVPFLLQGLLKSVMKQACLK